MVPDTISVTCVCYCYYIFGLHHLEPELGASHPARLCHQFLIPKLMITVEPPNRNIVKIKRDNSLKPERTVSGT